MKKIGSKKVLEHGDIVTINGQTYYCDQDLPCYECALKGNETCLNRRGSGYDCTYRHVSLMTAGDAIRREKSNIKTCRRLINEFIQEKETEIKNSQDLISKLSEQDGNE